jgi:hypothetical protein
MYYEEDDEEQGNSQEEGRGKSMPAKISPPSGQQAKHVFDD